MMFSPYLVPPLGLGFGKIQVVGPGELRRLKQLEEEIRKLKRLVADLSLDKAILQDIISKKL